jgi:hypothetical protein
MDDLLLFNKELKAIKIFKNKNLDEKFRRTHIFSWDLGSERSKAHDH